MGPLAGILLGLILVLQSSQCTEAGAAATHGGAVWEEPGGVRDSAARTLTTLHYPHLRVGPYNWQYFRADVPHAFQKMKIELTKLWAPEKINKNGLLNPLVCFRLGAPPSPTLPLASLEEAAIAAGHPQNASNMGSCASFTNTTMVVLDNQQVVAGVWHVGVFSNSQPTRFQSKMISRGPVYAFGLRLTVFGCDSSSVTGPHCNLTITQICTEDPRPSPAKPSAQQASLRRSESAQRRQTANTPIKSISKDASWACLENQKVGPLQWKYYALQVTLFATEMEVKTGAPDSGEAAQGPLNLYVRYGALPTEADTKSSDSLSVSVRVPVPKRGGWHIGVFNPAQSGPDQSFSLLWNLQNCDADRSGDECKWPAFHLERILQENAYESPFDSFFTPPAGKFKPAPAEWFPLKPSSAPSMNSHTSGPSSETEEWSYFFIQIPHGVAGATLTLELRHVPQSSADFYARHEGLPTLELYDFGTQNLNALLVSESHDASKAYEVKIGESGARAQPLGSTAALHMMLPLEGMWCVGVRTMDEELLSVIDGVSEVVVEQFESLPPLPLESAAPGLRTTAHWLKLEAGAKIVPPDPIVHPKRVAGYLVPVATGVTHHGRHHGFVEKKAEGALEDIVSVEQSLSTSSAWQHAEWETSANGKSGKRMPRPMMRVTIHGCPKQCSGHGSCQTTYDASRLYLFSYCHCDSIHGGEDCSVVLLLPAEEAIHIWALVGSNFAAILPSLWAIRHNAYAEWVTYTLSGTASGVYHSCDAGGWCALSYDTLQFLDFWLSFLAVVMTCLYIASLQDGHKAMAQMGAAIITAAVTKENATSAWNVLLVVLMGAVGLLFGWALECWQLHLLPTWLHALVPLQRAYGNRLEELYSRAEEFMRQMKKRFRWVYLFIGLAILLLAGLSWILESDDSYWIWHSLWHVSIYTSAFVILCSTSRTNVWPSHDSHHVDPDHGALLYAISMSDEDLTEPGSVESRHTTHQGAELLGSLEDNKLEV